MIVDNQIVGIQDRESHDENRTSIGIHMQKRHGKNGVKHGPWKSFEISLTERRYIIRVTEIKCSKQKR